jgi:hypothetical protein
MRNKYINQEKRPHEMYRAFRGRFRLFGAALHNADPPSSLLGQLGSAGTLRDEEAP